jgi:hypothetical protein
MLPPFQGVELYQELHVHPFEFPAAFFQKAVLDRPGRTEAVGAEVYFGLGTIDHFLGCNHLLDNHADLSVEQSHQSQVSIPVGFPECSEVLGQLFSSMLQVLVCGLTLLLRTSVADGKHWPNGEKTKTRDPDDFFAPHNTIPWSRDIKSRGDSTSNQANNEEFRKISSRTCKKTLPGPNRKKLTGFTTVDRSPPPNVPCVPWIGVRPRRGLSLLTRTHG